MEGWLRFWVGVISKDRSKKKGVLRGGSVYSSHKDGQLPGNVEKVGTCGRT